MRKKKILIALLVTLLVLTSAAGITLYRALGTFTVPLPAKLREESPGGLVSVQRTGDYPRFAVQSILNSVDLPEPLQVTHGITLYRVQYRTTNYDGSAVFASGLVALPHGEAMTSVVVYHHGTNAERRTAPSQPGLGEGTLIASAAAGTGHILLAPDYIGLGESRAIHPYMVSKATVSTSIDFIHAARSFITFLQGKCPESLYLMGFSQGGHAAFAVQRALEKLHDPQLQVRACAPIAGPFHVREISFPQAMTGQTTSHAFYLAYLALAYAHVYDHSLRSILASPYLEELPPLYDGDHTTEQISRALPANPRDLFVPEFLEAYDAGRPHWFLDALTENDVCDWTPLAPVRIYYGEQDLDVLPAEALRAEAEMKPRGADIQALSVGPYTHDASVLRAVPRALRWFTELAQTTPAP